MSENTIIDKKEIECPGCKQKIDVEIQKQKPKVTVIEESQTIQHEKPEHNHVYAPDPHEKPEHNHVHAPDPHDELAKTLPKGWNFATCKDGNCGKIVKNPNGLVTEFKKCPTCGDNTNKKSSKICKTCGKKPNEDDGEEWEESEVSIEKEIQGDDD